ncbi:MAG: 4Fe-4S binding protein [Firmicutes bacterium]|nr:4Fe-4S binding protein [Bacillota bacterium]
MSNKEEVTEKLVINKEWCKGCGICVSFCPKNVLTLKDGKVDIADIEKCIECGQCELRCPDYAIYLRGKKNEK